MTEPRMKHSMEGKPLPTQAQLGEYLKLKPLFTSAYNEMKELSKKKPDGVMTALKVTLLNRLLRELKAAMQADPKVEYLDVIDEESLPLHSDVVLVLSQYEAAIDSFRNLFHGQDAHTPRYGGGRWFTEEEPPQGHNDSDL